MQTSQAGGARRPHSDPSLVQAWFGRGAPGRGTLRGAAILGLTALLAGCASRPPVASTPGAPVYAIDLQGGAAHCNSPKPTLQPGKTTRVAMRVGNDGGWCAITVARNDGTDGPKPYAAGLLLAPAAHGKVYIHTVGDVTRIDYTPAPGFAGTDRFRVSLLPGQAAIAAEVTVVR